MPNPLSLRFLSCMLPKVHLVCLLLMVGWVMGAHSVIASQQGEPNIHFRWGFVAKEGDTKYTPIHGDTTLAAGHHVKMWVALQQGRQVFVYVVYQRASGEMYLLFPYSAESREALPAATYSIPQGPQWFSIEPTAGSDTIYLLASTARLAHLEALFSRYNAASAEKQTALAQQIRTDIRTTIKSSLTLPKPAERPISMAGSAFRQGEPDLLEKFGLDITATDFYWKTFTIDYR